MSIEENLAAVEAAIKKAMVEAGDFSGAGALIAVSKTRPVEDIKAVLKLGQRRFGENRVQEAASKFPELKAAYGDLELHLIGPLQSNKVRDAVALFDVIQSVDRPKIAAALAREMASQGRDVRLFVQVNVGEEAQKAGVLPQDLDAFLCLCREEYQLNIAGLMCIPPIGLDPSPYFLMLRKLAKRYGVAELSMGMSADFATGVQFGADYVRVGTAIFGSRG